MPSQNTLVWVGAAASAVVVAAGAGAVVWTHPGLLGRNPAEAPPVVASAPAEPKPRRSSASAGRPAAPPTASAPAPADKAPATGAAASPLEPAFDVVNVDPSGEAVIAGRAAPNAKVELRDAGKTVAEATADAAGQFVIIPPALAPGDHSLSLAASADKTQPAMSSPVAVSVPRAGSQGRGVAAPVRTKAAAAAPRQPMRRRPRRPLQAMRTVATPARAPAPASPSNRSRPTPSAALVAKGSAEPNATVRLYLNDADVADAKTQADGRWSLTIKHGMTPGGYLMRADEINPGGATRCCERQHAIRLSGGAGVCFACRPGRGLRKPSAIVRGLAGRPGRRIGPDQAGRRWAIPCGSSAATTTATRRATR